MTTTNAELIAEARTTMNRQEWMPASLGIRLADALEAATTITEERAEMLTRVIYDRTQLVRGDAEDLAWDLLAALSNPEEAS